MAGNRSWVLRWVGVLACATALGGCAEERAPINQVQANVLDKEFFVGDLVAADDDPEFYTAVTVIDTPYGADQGVFPGMVGGLRRVKFEILEDVLNVRLTYEQIDSVDGHGSRVTNNGRVIASYRIADHFDIKRAYNSQTGEELNVITENSSDRPWYERRYMRVDWSANLINSSTEWDPLAGLGDTMGAESLAYYVSDPNSPDKPVFDTENGYFDVTGKLYLKPKQVQLEGNTYTACQLRGAFVIGGTYPWGVCENTEVTVRSSFKRIAHAGEPGFTDYEPKHWDGTRMNGFGIFTHDRLGADPRYGIVDSKWYRFAGRYNIWQKSHTAVACDLPDAPISSDVTNPDADHDGTDDVCASAGAGSRCDDVTGLCTVPYSQREIRPVPWHYTIGPAGDAVIHDWTFSATKEWDTALRVAVQAARRVECTRTAGRSLEGTRWAGQKCEDAFPILQGDDEELKAVKSMYDCWAGQGYLSETCVASNPNSVAAMRPVVVFCNNPVAAGDDPACGAPGLVVRPGDIRYHHLAMWPTRQSSSPWGYGPSLGDPLTGELISVGVNVYDTVTTSAAQSFIDQIRWIAGEIKSSEISSGTYIKDWASASAAVDSAASRGLAGGQLIPSEELDRRLLAVGGMTPEALASGQKLSDITPLKDFRAAIQRDLDQHRMLPDTSGASRAVFDQRLAAAKASPIEAQLVNSMWVQAGGMDGDQPVSAETLDQVSPLRGLHPRALLAAQQAVEKQLARVGQCLVGAPEPTGLPALAKVMQRKFPVGSNETPSDTRARVDRMVDYVRGRMHYSVILHEMGHTVGFRHNFVSSWDSTNFRPQYWQLRTDNGRVKDVCTSPTPDGKDCVGPRYWDGMTKDEIDGSIWTWEHTTVMDYPGEVTQDMLGLGVYDYAAARMFYGDVVDVATDPALVADHANPDDPAGARIVGTPEGNEFVNLVDNTGGLVGQIVQKSSTEFAHYSERNTIFHLIRNCRPADTSAPATWSEERDGVYDPVFDGHIVLGTVCDRMPVDYVAYDDLVPDQLQDVLNSDPRFSTSRRARDVNGRPRMPYGFESDEYVNGWSPSTYQHDNGADLFEELTFHTNLYENRHIWDNFRNGRVTFNISSAYNRAMSRYHVKIADLTQGVAYLVGFYAREYARNAGISRAAGVNLFAGPGSPYRETVIGAGLGLDHFVRVLTRPHIGDHSSVDLDGDFVGDILQPDADVIGPGPLFPTRALTVPNGTTFTADGSLTFGGRPLNNSFEFGNGYFGVDYLNQVGSYYEKALAFELMMTASYNIINFFRFDGLDGRFHHNNFTDLWPDAMRRMIGSMLTGDSTLFAPRVTADATGVPETTQDTPDGPLWPKNPLAWVSYNAPTGPEVCWPTNGVMQCRDAVGNPINTTGATSSVPIDPQLGFEVQKFIAFWTYVYMPEAGDNDWVDSMRIFVVGPDQNPDYLPTQMVEWRDPVSGQRYIARKYGNETLLGKTYDKGIAAKMIQWANLLTAKAYNVASIDPATGAVTPVMDAQGQPVLANGATACTDVRACDDLRAYRGLMDFMRDTAAHLGFPEPALQVVGWEPPSK